LVGDWLAQVYTGEALANWETEYQASLREFETAILKHLAPFNSGEFDLLFYRMFDGLEVLPQAFLATYETLVEAGNYLEASALLVPLSWHTYQRLLRAGRAWQDTPTQRSKRSLFVVDVTYTTENGLDISSGLTPIQAIEAD
jgi:hypothetical protein